MSLMKVRAIIMSGFDVGYELRGGRTKRILGRTLVGRSR
jgi:hypothetical protein